MIHQQNISFFSLLIIFIHFCSIVSANQSTHKIEILVNDKIITNYDIAQHFAINSILDNINVTSENKDFLFNKTVNELIDMKIKQAKIKDYDIKIKDENKEYYENYYFQSKRLDKDKVYEIISGNDLDIDALKEKINTSIAWEQLTAGLFLHTISISDSEVSELLKSDVSLSPEIAKRILTNKQVQLKSDKYLRDLRAEANIEKR
ncbi:MAG: hypothetical protein P8M06_00635 [Pelagibacterales bacterium]|nr:hypothetical protein [Pelagibacterales bacterium]